MVESGSTVELFISPKTLAGARPICALLEYVCRGAPWKYYEQGNPDRTGMLQIRWGHESQQDV